MPLPTVSFLVNVGVRPDIAQIVSPHLQTTCAKFDISTREQMSGFVAQCMHESQMFTKMEEDLHYSSHRLQVCWPHRFPTSAIADQYAMNPEKLANYIYAKRIGNGDEKSGDGWLFRGSGYMQTTGRDNFWAAYMQTKVNYLVSPDLPRREPLHAALISGGFWIANNLNKVIETGGFAAVTHKVNPGDSRDASENRLHFYARCFAASMTV